MNFPSDFLSRYSPVPTRSLFLKDRLAVRRGVSDDHKAGFFAGDGGVVPHAARNAKSRTRFHRVDFFLQAMVAGSRYDEDDLLAVGMRVEVVLLAGENRHHSERHFSGGVDLGVAEPFDLAP